MSYDSHLEPPENNMTDLDHAIGHAFESIEALSDHMKELERKGEKFQLDRLNYAMRGLSLAKEIMEMEKFPF